MWLLLMGVMAMAPVQVLPESDVRLTQVRHLNLRYELPIYRTADEWQQRAEALRWQVQIACGLFPSLLRTPLNPRRIVCYEDDDIVVERIAFESFPNFFITGNLYRPKKGKPPYPAVLHPHGHVPQPLGRLEENERIRAMAMAKLGFVVFAYDMVGYGDQFQVVHRASETPQEHLWAISKAAVQTWNSTRALDFMLSLPEVDKKRIGCGGLSGGGTQTFLLTAVDERIAVSVPTKMVSAHMQGGCICENPPLLRLDATNPEIAALAAPHPLLLISDDGDWTKETPNYEFPLVQSIYQLLNANDRCANAHFNEGHSFAKGSREAYYAWMVRWLKSDGKPLTEPVKEPSIQLPDVQRFRIWGDDLPKPHNAITWDALVRWLKEQANTVIEQMRPKDAKTLRKFQQMMRVALQRTLAVTIPTAEQIIAQEGELTERNSLKMQRLWIGRNGIGDRVPALLVTKTDAAGRRGVSDRDAVLLVSENGASSEVWNGSNETFALAQKLVQRFPVLAIDAFLTGMASGERERDGWFFTTYNRTDDAERIQDIVTALTFLHGRYKRVHVVGMDIAGLWVLLARAVTDGDGKTVVDAAQFDARSDDEFVKRLYIPCLRRVGDMRTALAVMSPRPLLVHDAHPDFPQDWAVVAYRVAKAEKRLQWHHNHLPAVKIVEWIVGAL